MADFSENVIREAFVECDYQGRGEVQIDHLVDVLDRLGINPTPAELMRYRSHFQKLDQDCIHFPAFLAFVQELSKEIVPTEILNQDIKIFDIDFGSTRSERPGYIRVSMLRHGLRSCGVKMSPQYPPGDQPRVVRTEPRGNPNDLDDLIGLMKTEGEWVKYEEVLRIVGKRL